jgi:3-methylcrotonyl-CoA carboxylase beta subunit
MTMIGRAARCRALLIATTSKKQQPLSCLTSPRQFSTAAAGSPYQDNLLIHHHQPPPLLNCELDTQGENFQQASERTRTQVEELQQMLQKLSLGGGAKSVQRHVARNKLVARDRIQRLCDPGTPLIELSALAGYHPDPAKDVPSGGIVTSIGVVSGQLCMMIANDATVKGGTYYPITVKKHLRAQEIALENDLPCIYLVDSGGAYLPKQAEVFPDKNHFGR